MGAVGLTGFATVVGGAIDRFAAAAGDAPIPIALAATVAMTKSRRMSSFMLIPSLRGPACSVVIHPWSFRAFRHKIQTQEPQRRPRRADM